MQRILCGFFLILQDCVNDLYMFGGGFFVAFPDVNACKQPYPHALVHDSFLGRMVIKPSCSSLFRASRIGVRLASISFINRDSRRKVFGRYSYWMIFCLLVS